MNISTKNPKMDRVVDVEVNLPITVAEQVDVFGEDVVAACVVSEVTKRAQARVRQMIGANADDGMIQTAMDTWKPGIRMPAQPGKATLALMQRLLAMDPTERDAYIREHATPAADGAGDPA